MRGVLCENGKWSCNISMLRCQQFFRKQRVYANKTWQESPSSAEDHSKLVVITCLPNKFYATFLYHLPHVFIDLWQNNHFYIVARECIKNDKLLQNWADDKESVETSSTCHVAKIHKFTRTHVSIELLLLYDLCMDGDPSHNVIDDSKTSLSRLHRVTLYLARETIDFFVPSRVPIKNPFWWRSKELKNTRKMGSSLIE